MGLFVTQPNRAYGALVTDWYVCVSVCVYVLEQQPRGEDQELFFSKAVEFP